MNGVENRYLALSLCCPPLMLPRQLNKHLIHVNMDRRGEDLIVKTRYHHLTHNTPLSDTLNFYVCLTISLIEKNKNMILQKSYTSRLKPALNIHDKVVFPYQPWNTFNQNKPLSILLRVLPTL